MSLSCPTCLSRQWRCFCPPRSDTRPPPERSPRSVLVAGWPGRTRGGAPGPTGLHGSRRGHDGLVVGVLVEVDVQIVVEVFVVLVEVDVDLLVLVFFVFFVFFVVLVRFVEVLLEVFLGQIDDGLLQLISRLGRLG